MSDTNPRIFGTGTMALLLVPAVTLAQGSLTPPAPPQPTMKTLEQVEPRTPIESLPYYISQPGSYYVAGPLSSSSDGIVINTSDVTVDLNGYTLSCTATSYVTRGVSVQGSSLSPRRRVTVRNGMLSGFYHAVYAECSIGCTFKDLTSSASRGSGIRLYAAGSAPST